MYYRKIVLALICSAGLIIQAQPKRAGQRGPVARAASALRGAARTVSCAALGAATTPVAVVQRIGDNNLSTVAAPAMPPAEKGECRLVQSAKTSSSSGSAGSIADSVFIGRSSSGITEPPLPTDVISMADYQNALALVNRERGCAELKLIDCQQRERLMRIVCSFVLLFHVLHVYGPFGYTECNQ